METHPETEGKVGCVVSTQLRSIPERCLAPSLEGQESGDLPLSSFEFHIYQKDEMFFLKRGLYMFSICCLGFYMHAVFFF